MKIRPAKEPYQPSYSELIAKRRSLPIVIPDMTWNLYLRWSPELVRLDCVRPQVNFDTEEDVSLRYYPS